MSYQGPWQIWLTFPSSVIKTIFGVLQSRVLGNGFLQEHMSHYGRPHWGQATRHRRELAPASLCDNHLSPRGRDPGKATSCSFSAGAKGIQSPWNKSVKAPLGAVPTCLGETEHSSSEPTDKPSVQSLDFRVKTTV